MKGFSETGDLVVMLRNLRLSLVLKVSSVLKTQLGNYFGMELV